MQQILLYILGVAPQKAQDMAGLHLRGAGGALAPPWQILAALKFLATV